MGSRTVFAAAITALPAVVAAAELVGPEKIEPGDLAILRLDIPENAQVAWQAFGPEKTVTNWVALERGRVVVFASRTSGVYHFACAIWYGQLIQMLVHRLGNGERQPEPKPPDPPRPPQPHQAWAEWAREKAIALVGPPRQKEALLLAASFEKIAAGIKAGQFSTPRQAREALRTTSRAALGEAALRWGRFSDAVDAQMDGLSAKGQLTTLDQYAEIWMAIAAGLETVP